MDDKNGCYKLIETCMMFYMGFFAIIGITMLIQSLITIADTFCK